MERIMAILGCEGDYAQRLCDFANHRKKLPLKAAAFRDYESYSRFAQSHHIVLLLAEPELIAGEYDLRADRVIHLCAAERTAETAGLLSGCDAEIYKYQSGDDILCAAMQLAGSMGEAVHFPGAKKHARLVSVYSPLGRCGKTAFSLLYAINLGREEKVLYLNFEEFAALPEAPEKNGGSGLSDALYHMKQGELDAARLSSLVRDLRGVDFLSPCRSAEDVRAAEPEEYRALLETVLREADYHCVVLDPGNSPLRPADLLELSDTVFMPVLSDAVSVAKLAGFDRFLEEEGNAAYAEKICRLTLPWEEPGRTPGDGLDRLLMSPLGDFVRRLCG